MTFTDTIWINGRSLEDMKMYPASVKGILSGQGFDWPEVVVPGNAGVVIGSSEGKLRPRDITIEGRIEVLTYDLLLPTIQEFLTWLAFGPLEVVTARDPSKVYYGRVEDEPILAYEPELLSVDASVSIKIRCQDPLVYDRCVTRIGFGTSPVDVPVGTAWTSGILRVSNVPNPFTITMKAANGITTQSFTLPVAASAAEYITIDSRNRVVTKTSGGVTTPVLAAITGDFPLVLSPFDGTSDSPPTIQLSSGVGEFIFRKAYL